jgi:ribosome-associated translation inhibitor RaiA
MTPDSSDQLLHVKAVTLKTMSITLRANGQQWTVMNAIEKILGKLRAGLKQKNLVA